MVGSGLTYLQITVLLLRTQAFLPGCVACLWLTSSHMDGTGLAAPRPRTQQCSRQHPLKPERLLSGCRRRALQLDCNHPEGWSCCRGPRGPPSSRQTLEATTPTEIRISPGISGWRKEEAEPGVSQRWILGPRKRFHTVLKTCPTGA